jgi:hypothetical protein
MSEQEQNGLTLEELAQRLEALERENAELQSKVATLEKSGTRRDELAENRGSDTPREGEPATEEFAGRVSRRSLLSKAGAAAVAAAAAGTLLNPREAKADHYDPAIRVDKVNVHCDSGVGVYSESTRSTGVWGISPLTGVVGYASRGGAQGGQDSVGVLGTGVKALEIGVEGRGGRIGVKGTGHYIGLYGSDGDIGVLASGKNNGVLARGGHIGVSGYGPKYGGVFNADKGGAQLLLQPGESRDRPTIGDHVRGELYMDATGTLFVCTDGGNPGVWRVVQTGPA